MGTIRNIFAAGLVGLLGCGQESRKEEANIAPFNEVAEVVLLAPPTNIPSTPEEEINTPPQTDICAAVTKAKTDILYDKDLVKIGPVISELEEIFSKMDPEKKREVLEGSYNPLTVVGIKASRNGGAIVNGSNVLGPFNYSSTEGGSKVVSFNIAAPGVHISYNLELSKPGEKWDQWDLEYMKEANVKLEKIRYKPAGRNGQSVYEHILAVDALASRQIQPTVQNAFYDISVCDGAISPEKQKVMDNVLNPAIKLWETIYQR